MIRITSNGTPGGGHVYVDGEEVDNVARVDLSINHLGATATLTLAHLDELDVTPGYHRVRVPVTPIMTERARHVTEASGYSLPLPVMYDALRAALGWED